MNAFPRFNDPSVSLREPPPLQGGSVKFLPEGEVAAKPTEGSFVRRGVQAKAITNPLAKRTCSYYVLFMPYHPPPPLQPSETIAPTFTPARVARLGQSLKVTKGNRNTAL